MTQTIVTALCSQDIEKVLALLSTEVKIWKFICSSDGKCGQQRTYWQEV